MAGKGEGPAIEIIANDQGNRTTPSYVAFTDSERLIGDAAKNQVAMNPINTVFDARLFLFESWMTRLDQNFRRKLTNGKALVLLIELEIGPAPDLFSVEADHIDPCLTDEQRHNASRSQGLTVLGLNKNGEKWNLQLRKENETYFFTGAANGWVPGTEICIWGAPGGIFSDGELRFVFTDGS